MVKIIFCATFIFAMMIGVNTTSAAEYMYTPTISVSGEGVVEAPPDVATISVGVVSRDRDAAKVQNENSRAANNVINAIASLGIDRKNIRTGNYNFREIFHSDTNHKQIFDGYEVTNTVTITVTDLNKVGRVIDAALSNGANAVNSLHFGIRDREKFQSEALRLAVRDARKKAEIAAAELGKIIVSVKNVSINSASVTMPRMEKMAMMSANDATFETPIESGTLNCSASVHVEFEISR
ncbi:MAG: SIMPL domain-containing protein [Selenomonadaceae bacterium]|nr:SIMPL domain-containing protein [Selenomonadaceae bacterium]